MAADDPGNSISWNIPVSAPQGLIIDHPGIWEKTGNFPITLFPVYNMGPVSPSTFHQQFMNSSKITHWGGPVQGHQIITKFCTCHDSTTVVACAILCNDHFDEIWMRVVISIKLEQLVNRSLIVSKAQWQQMCVWHGCICKLAAGICKWAWCHQWYICGVEWKHQVSRAWLADYIKQNAVKCNYFSRTYLWHKYAHINYTCLLALSSQEAYETL